MLTEKDFKELGIPFLPENDYKKAIGQFRLQLGGVFQPFKMYGMDAFIPGAIEEVVKLAEDLGMRLRGIDKPIDLERVRAKRKK